MPDATGAGATPQRRRHPPRQPEPAHARRLRRHASSRRRTSTRFARALAALREALRRLAALHARAPRHPLRRARLPLEALGLDRDLGGRDHAPPARGGRRHAADLRPPAPVRDRRRELPHRLHRLGLPARPRERPLEDAPRPELDGRAAASAGGRMPYDNSRGYFRDESRLPGPAHDGGRRAAGSTTTPATTTASSSSSTSSTRTSRSTRPSRTRRCTTTPGRART